VAGGARAAVFGSWLAGMARGYLGTVRGSGTGKFKPPDTVRGARYVCPHSREAGGGRLYSFIWAKKKPAHGGLRERRTVRK